MVQALPCGFLGDLRGFGVGGDFGGESRRGDYRWLQVDLMQQMVSGVRLKVSHYLSHVDCVVGMELHTGAHTGHK